MLKDASEYIGVSVCLPNDFYCHWQKYEYNKNEEEIKWKLKIYFYWIYFEMNCVLNLLILKLKIYNSAFWKPKFSIEMFPFEKISISL